MTRLADNSWGKSSVRVSKVHRGEESDGFSDVTVQILLRGEVEAAYLEGDNRRVLPTDTMRNTVYCLAQEHLGDDLEGFGRALATHFLAKEGVTGADIELEQRRWDRSTPQGFVGGSTERRTARVEASLAEGETVWGGIDGLAVLKTTNSAFAGFPKDEYTILPETDDRVLATTVTCWWRYGDVSGETTETWMEVRKILLERFFSDWSASVQHQGWQMAEAVLKAVPAIEEISFRLPNQHHLAFHLERFGMEDRGVIFQPVAEPFGDIRFTATR